MKRKIKQVEIKINPEWMDYLEKGAKFPKWLEKILDFDIKFWFKRIINIRKAS